MTRYKMGKHESIALPQSTLDDNPSCSRMGAHSYRKKEEERNLVGGKKRITETTGMVSTANHSPLLNKRSPRKERLSCK